MRKLSMCGLTLACLMAGYGFYRANNGDWINAVAFTFGILGILLSVFRTARVDSKNNP